MTNISQVQSSSNFYLQEARTGVSSDVHLTGSQTDGGYSVTGYVDSNGTSRQLENAVVLPRSQDGGYDLSALRDLVSSATDGSALAGLKDKTIRLADSGLTRGTQIAEVGVMLNVREGRVVGYQQNGMFFEVRERPNVEAFLLQVQQATTGPLTSLKGQKYETTSTTFTTGAADFSVLTQGNTVYSYRGLDGSDTKLNPPMSMNEFLFKIEQGQLPGAESLKGKQFTTVELHTRSVDGNLQLLEGDKLIFSETLPRPSPNSNPYFAPSTAAKLAVVLMEVMALKQEIASKEDEAILNVMNFLTQQLEIKKSAIDERASADIQHANAQITGAAISIAGSIASLAAVTYAPIYASRANNKLNAEEAKSAQVDQSLTTSSSSANGPNTTGKINPEQGSTSQVNKESREQMVEMGIQDRQKADASQQKKEENTALKTGVQGTNNESVDKTEDLFNPANDQSDDAEYSVAQKREVDDDDFSIEDDIEDEPLFQKEAGDVDQSAQSNAPANTQVIETDDGPMSSKDFDFAYKTRSNDYSNMTKNEYASFLGDKKYDAAAAADRDSFLTAPNAIRDDVPLANLGGANNSQNASSDFSVKSATETPAKDAVSNNASATSTQQQDSVAPAKQETSAPTSNKSPVDVQREQISRKAHAYSQTGEQIYHLFSSIGKLHENMQELQVIERKAQVDKIDASLNTSHEILQMFSQQLLSDRSKIDEEFNSILQLIKQTTSKETDLQAQLFRPL